MDGQLQFIQLEVMVVALGLLVLLADLFLSESVRRSLGYFAAGALGLVFLLSFRGSYVGLVDGEALVVRGGFLLKAELGKEMAGHDHSH